MFHSFGMLRRTSSSIAIGAVLSSCAASTPNGGYYVLPSNSEASVQPAIIEGTFVRSARICGYVFSVDGQEVGDRADCTAAVPISPGKHTIAAWLESGSRRPHAQSFRRIKATLVFDAEEGHNYKIAFDRVYASVLSLRAVVWINDATTKTAVTEATVVTSRPVRETY